MLKLAGTEGFEIVRRQGPLLLFILCRMGFPTFSLLKFVNAQATEQIESAEDKCPVSQAQATQKVSLEGSQGSSPGSAGLVSHSRS